MKRKKIVISTLCITLLMSGCSRKSQPRLTYEGEDGSISSSIGTYVTATSADFLSDSLTVVMEEENNMSDSKITAKSAFMINETKQEVLFATNVYDRIYPASTTKLLTALIVLKYGNLNEEVTVNKDNAGITVPGAKLCNFKAGDKMSLGTLLNCLLVYSGNDAAIAIGEHMYGSEEAFVEKMNEEAALLGATNTHFVNSHGLHNPNHYTTAYDMYLIFRECIQYDEFLPIIKQQKYEAVITGKDSVKRTATYETTNMFLLGTMDVPEGVTVFGGKTGSTSDAGDCLVLLSKTAEDDQCISAVFKANGKTSLYQQLAHLLTLN